MGSWGLSSVVDSDTDVALFERPYDDVATMNVKQGGYDPDDLKPVKRYTGHERHVIKPYNMDPDFGPDQLKDTEEN